MDLSSNNLYGELSHKWGQCGSLTSLNISHNNLSGIIPPQLGEAIQLHRLDLSSNHLLGKIPRELGKLTSMFHLVLSNNQLSGNIPLENKFGESIPDEIGNMHSLQNLDLSQNMLNGKIPQQLGELQRLETLNLSHNELSGSIPSTFEDMLSLTSVDISSNQLEGPLPDIKAFQEAPFEAFMSNGGLCGNATGLKPYIIEVTEEFNSKYCIGSGGQGTVYKAELPTGRVVAVKKLHPPQDGEMSSLKAFTSEIRALTEIRHRNIVKFYGYCSHARHSFLVYKLMEKGSLRNILSNEEEAIGLDWIRRLNIVKGSCIGLWHSKAFKARLIIQLDLIRRHLWSLLTPPRWNNKTDVYSYGVVALEVIMGKHPGDLISSLSSASSSSSVTAVADSLLLKDAIDQRLSPPIHQISEEVAFAVKLAFACQHVNPHCRPTMRQVSQALSSQKPPLQKTIPHYYIERAVSGVIIRKLSGRWSIWKTSALFYFFGLDCAHASESL
ncbi:MDIS1-interacting receptor like kinase 2 [Vitis vinifera]|uniref:non-specific serine/threonine protein kinase n=1 Tax=Vitis vinifera TaxID=29760 RepID=A0A438BRR3_VITVI|nr:MDIS1-interacting receptor like kinase 2 [Vitis vinifera]